MVEQMKSLAELQAVKKQEIPVTPPAKSLRDAAQELLEITQNMVKIVNGVADDIETHLLRVRTFQEVVANTWEKDINPSNHPAVKRRSPEN